MAAPMAAAGAAAAITAAGAAAETTMAEQEVAVVQVSEIP